MFTVTVNLWRFNINLQQIASIHDILKFLTKLLLKILMKDWQWILTTLINSRILSVPKSGVNSAIVGHVTFGSVSAGLSMLVLCRDDRRLTSAGTMYSSSGTSHQSLSSSSANARLIAMSTSSCATRAYSASHIPTRSDSASHILQQILEFSDYDQVAVVHLQQQYNTISPSLFRTHIGP